METGNKYDSDRINLILTQINEIAPSPSWAPVARPSFPINHRSFQAVQNRFLDLPFLDYELEFVLSQLNLKSCPGIDNVDYKIISTFPPSIRQLLLRIFNEMYAGGFYPREWSDCLFHSEKQW